MASRAPDVELQTARSKIAKMPDSVVRNVLSVFIDNNIHSVVEMWDYVDGRTDRFYTHREKQQRVGAYIQRANLALEGTGRFIGRVSRGNYKLLHKKL